MKKYQHYVDAQGEVLPTPHRNNDRMLQPKKIFIFSENFILSALPDTEYVLKETSTLHLLYINRNWRHVLELQICPKSKCSFTLACLSKRKWFTV